MKILLLVLISYWSHNSKQ